METKMPRNINQPYLYSPIARTLYERLQTENEMKNFDKTAWYSCKIDDLPLSIAATFLQMSFDNETSAFLENCYEKADWLFTQIFHSLACAFLSIFMTKTSINGFLGRGSMFVMSDKHFQQLMGISDSWKGDNLLDLGAGDGKVTEIMANYFHRTSVTEASIVMRNLLIKKGYTVAEIDTWFTESVKYDLISCLNLLDRCETPLTLLQQMKNMLKPETGLMLVAIVLPFHPYVEFGSNGTTQPRELMKISGSTFEEQVASLESSVFGPAGVEIVRWTKLPYLCEGNLHRSYYWLIDAVFLLRSKQLSQTENACHLNVVDEIASCDMDDVKL